MAQPSTGLTPRTSSVWGHGFAQLEDKAALFPWVALPGRGRWLHCAEGADVGGLYSGLYSYPGLCSLRYRVSRVF